MTEIMTRMTDPELTGMKPQMEVYYNGLWFTFSELVCYKEFKDLKLKPYTVAVRYKTGARTIEKLMRPARKYFGDLKNEEEDRWEGVSPELRHALEFGTIEDLLKCS